MSSKKNRNNRVVENTNIQKGDAMGIVEEVEGTEVESTEVEGQPLAEVEGTEVESPAQSEESGDGIEDAATLTEEEGASEPTQEEPAVDEKAEVVDEESDSKLKDDEVDAALKEEVIINEPTVEQSNLVDAKTDNTAVAESKSIPSSFSKTVLLEILDSEVIVDASNATIYNTEEDMRAAAKLERIYETTVSLGVNHPISKVVSQALKFARTTADKRKGDMLYGTLIREINNASSGNDFDLLIFTVVKIFKSFRTLGELATIRSLRDVKNVEMKAAAQALAHIFAQLATVEDRKKKLNVTISLDKLLKVSSSGLNQNGINLIKEYFSK